MGGPGPGGDRSGALEFRDPGPLEGKFRGLRVGVGLDELERE